MATCLIRLEPPRSVGKTSTDRHCGVSAFCFFSTLPLDMGARSDVVTTIMIARYTIISGDVLRVTDYFQQQNCMAGLGRCNVHATALVGGTLRFLFHSCTSSEYRIFNVWRSGIDLLFNPENPVCVPLSCSLARWLSRREMGKPHRKKLGFCFGNHSHLLCMDKKQEPFCGWIIREEGTAWVLSWDGIIILGVTGSWSVLF